MKLNRKAIDLLLAKKKMTIKEAAATAGISDRTLYRGLEKDITPKHIGQIADALGARVEDIIIQEEK